MTGSTPKHPYFTMISQFLKAVSKPCKERKKIGRGQQHKEDKRVEEEKEDSLSF